MCSPFPEELCAVLKRNPVFVALSGKQSGVLVEMGWGQRLQYLHPDCHFLSEKLSFLVCELGTVLLSKLLSGSTEIFQTTPRDQCLAHSRYSTSACNGIETASGGPYNSCVRSEEVIYSFA